jgi:hypothetical protein
MKKLIPILLLLTCVLAVECISSPGNITLTCDPTSLDLELEPGESGSVNFQCCFTSEGNETFRLLVHNRDEWFIDVEQPDGTFTTIQELFPASVYVSDISAPENSTHSQVFEVDISLNLPASFTYQTGSADAGIEVLIDTELEQDPYSHIIISLKEPAQEPPSTEPPPNPVEQIIETVTKALGGGGGGGPPTIIQEPTQVEEDETSPPTEQPSTQGQTPAEQEEHGELPETSEIKIEVPEIIQEVIGTSDLAFNYILLVAGAFALLTGLILYLKFS